MWSAWKLMAVILLIAAVTMSSVPAVDTRAAHAQRQPAYAIYLSPGPQPDVSWGGYHITITGFSQYHAPGKSKKREAANAWNKVHGSPAYSFANKQRGTDYRACYLGKTYGYGICFKSKELDALAYELRDRKFDNQKQVDMVKKHNTKRWHVSLYARSPGEAYRKFEKYLKPVHWTLYEVKYPGAEWTPI